MHAVIGLGNPGRKYQATRHNIGFEIVNYSAEKHRLPFTAGKGDYYYADMRVHSNSFILVKPTTFMNKSGLALLQVCEYFRLNTEDILIIQDDLDLPFGTLRFRSSGGDGGHKGIRSIIYHLNTDRFDRMRFGIGDGSSEAVDHVLSPFNPSESSKLEDLLPIAYEAVLCWIQNGIEITMNRYNRSYLTDTSN